MSSKRASGARVYLSKANFKLQKEADNEKFRSWCHLEDLNNVCTLVRETWIQHTKVEMSFLSASMVTDVVFVLLLCVDDEFVTLQPSLDSYEKILRALSVDVATINHGCVQPMYYIVNTNPGAFTQKGLLQICSEPKGVRYSTYTWTDRNTF